MCKALCIGVQWIWVAEDVEGKSTYVEINLQDKTKLEDRF